MLHSADEYKLKAVNDILQQKLVKRGVSLKGLTYGAIEPAAGGTAKRKVTMQQGIAIEKAREIVKLDERLEKEDAGLDSGRPGPHQRQGSRHAAGDDCFAEGPRLRN